MRTFILALAGVVGLGCSALTESEAGDEFTLRVGQEVVVADAGVSVAFVGVDEDSRCPLQAMCVWAGDAAVLLEIAPWPDALAVDSRTDTLHTNLEPRELRLDGLELALVHLDPYPEASESIPQDQYVATFGVRAAR